ncbi:MAG TPA: DNA helicase [Pseudolysinimonas sp.]|nr:DNA helicase [Pseudolysinimonas sp.]
MSLSRKRQRELKRLKRSAEDLWDEQRAAIDHATDVLKDARRQAGNYAREEVGPRVRSAASGARDRFAHDVVPTVTGAVGSALAVLEAAKDPRVREVVRRVSKAGQRHGLVTPPKKSAGPGRYILAGLGLVAVLGVAYAAWQTLRADDDLWIEDPVETGSLDL